MLTFLAVFEVIRGHIRSEEDVCGGFDILDFPFGDDTTLSTESVRSTPLASWRRDLMVSLRLQLTRGRFVRPVIWSNVVGVGKDRAWFKIDQPEIPDAPKTSACFLSEDMSSGGVLCVN